MAKKGVRLRKMFKGIKKNELFAGGAIVLLAALLIAIFMYTGMRPGKGLRISAPAPGAFKLQTIDVRSSENSLEPVASASFMAAFGLDISPQVIMATQTQSVAEVTQPSQPATPTAVIESKPATVDLERLGYRLKGIVFENGQSAAFVHVPAEKKVVILRQLADGPVRLIEAGLRQIKLQTPEGTGYLKLEAARGASGYASSAAPTSGTGIQQNTGKTSQSSSFQQKQSDPQNPFGNANMVAEEINRGALRVSQNRGKYIVEVRHVPELLQGYDIKAGDRIIGTDAGEFTQSQDIATKLGAAGERSQKLRIQRGQRILTIDAPSKRAAPAQNRDSNPGVASNSAKTAP